MIQSHSNTSFISTPFASVDTTDTRIGDTPALPLVVVSGVVKLLRRSVAAADAPEGSLEGRSVRLSTLTTRVRSRTKSEFCKQT